MFDIPQMYYTAQNSIPLGLSLGPTSLGPNSYTYQVEDRKLGAKTSWLQSAYQVGERESTPLSS